VPACRPGERGVPEAQEIEALRFREIRGQEDPGKARISEKAVGEPVRAVEVSARSDPLLTGRVPQKVDPSQGVGDEPQAMVPKADAQVPEKVVQPGLADKQGDLHPHALIRFGGRGLPVMILPGYRLRPAGRALPGPRLRDGFLFREDRRLSRPVPLSAFLVVAVLEPVKELPAYPVQFPDRYGERFREVHRDRLHPERGLVHPGKAVPDPFLVHGFVAGRGVHRKGVRAGSGFRQQALDPEGAPVRPYGKGNRAVLQAALAVPQGA